jgi:fatty acid desaturase
MTDFPVSCSGFTVSHADEVLPAVLVIPCVAFFTSFLHELEHDLIHVLYFRKAPLIQNAMFAVIWALKMSLNPWARRELHLLHHKVSGQANDGEASSLKGLLS